MRFFIKPKEVLEEYHAVKNIGDGELPFVPQYYEFYKEQLSGRPLRLIERIERERKP